MPSMPFCASVLLYTHIQAEIVKFDEACFLLQIEFCTLIQYVRPILDQWGYATDFTF